MKIVKVYNAQGDEILACEVDLAHYQSKGWDVKKAAKPKVQAEKVEESE
jgi:Cu2+-containing amine oxidase